MDTFPCFLKKGGIIQTWIRLTPCIQPVRRAEKKTEKAAFFPVEQKSAREDRVPVKKKTPAQERGGGKLPDIQSGSGLDAEETEKRKQDTCENCSCVAQMVGFGNIRGHPGGDPIPKHSLENNGEHDK